MANRTWQITTAPGAPFWRQALESDVANLAHDPQKRVHAVIDGAFFDDLPNLFADHDLAARPLFTGDTPQALVKAGPWLVDVYHLPFQEPDEMAMATGADTAEPDLSDAAMEAQAAAMADEMRRLIEAGDDTGGLPQKTDEDSWQSSPPADPAAQIRALMQIADDKPALVFWIGGPDFTYARLYKHLRSLNMVLVPDDEKPGETQAVQFRHADGNVLASVLPVLDAAQFARLFGPALALTFHAPDYPDEDGWPVRRAVLPLRAEQAPTGMLRIQKSEIHGIKEARLERSRLRIARFLRRTASDQTENLTDYELKMQIKEYEKTARSIGIDQERSSMRFAWLMLCSDGRFLTQPGVREYLSTGPGTPNNRVHLLAEAMTEALTKGIS